MARRGSVWLIEAVPSIPTQNMKEANWLDLRRRGIGGSDIAAIMGRCPWRTPLGVYCEKVGLRPAQDPTEAMEFGTRMEPTLRSWTQDGLNKLIGGYNFRVLASPYLYRDPAAPFIANVDGVVVNMTVGGTEQEWSGLELKTVDRFYAKDWEDGLPVYYQDQVQWYMGVTGLERWVVGALIGKRFEVRIAERDGTAIQALQSAAMTFWTDYVERGVMPPASAEDGNLLVSLFPDASEEVVVDDTMGLTLANYLNALQEEKDAQARKADLRAILEQRIGGAKGLRADGYTATWNRFEVDRVDSKQLKADYPDVYEAVKKTSREGRLTVRKERSDE